MSDASRLYDVVVWGATGFTDELVAEYLVERYDGGAPSIALAGRSREKLEAVRARLAKVRSGAAGLPLLVGDSFDAAWPGPGEGPDRATREAGYFVTRLVGTGEDRAGRSVTLHARVEGQKDPGYGETAKMLGESAVCLALDELGSAGGVLTPASAMGERLIERLRTAGMVFEVGTTQGHPRGAARRDPG